ncbi:MAG: AMP-binding protein [Acetanaerobacterium sp.]
MPMLIERIVDNCRAYADKTAYQSLSGTITYAQLLQRACRLAGEIDRMAPRKSPVLVYGHKQPLMPVCFLACVLSGRAYVPVDDAVPPARVQKMAALAGAALVLAVSDIALCGVGTLDHDALARICGDETIHGDAIRPVMLRQDLFYIIFTSGSTGEPKGVRITYENIDAFVGALCGIPGLMQGDGAVLNQAAFSFDLSAADLYGALATGRTLFALEREAQRDMELLFDRLAHSNAQTAVLTPSFAELCLADRSFSSALMPRLEAVLFCGETLRPVTVRRLFQRFCGLRVFNSYGPTEATVAVTVGEITPDLADEDALPLGTEIAGTTIHVVDEGLMAVPDGRTGQFLVTGRSVGAGYTGGVQGGFIRFGEQRAFLTGDYGCRARGRLWFIGRTDDQVKHRGFRIELPDIEYNLCHIEGVARCAVVCVHDPGGREYLAAYVCPEQGAVLAAQGIRSALLRHLPAYMIPERVRIVDTLPLNPNGKCDHAALVCAEQS